MEGNAEVTETEGSTEVTKTAEAKGTAEITGTRKTEAELDIKG